MNILLDACVILAVLLEEPEKDIVLETTKNSILVVPNIIDFEIVNALSKLHKRKVLTEEEVYEIYSSYKQIPLHIRVEEDLLVIKDTSLAEDVIIKSKKGLNYKLSPIHDYIAGKSPFEGIKGIKAKVTTLELVEIVREGRSGI